MADKMNSSYVMKNDVGTDTTSPLQAGVKIDNGPGTSVRHLILEQIAQIADQQTRKLAPLTDDLKLLNSGLDSLCFAILVARLDDELGLDPLSDSAHAFPITIGDFIRLYEHAAA